MIGQQPQVVVFTPAQHELFIELDERASLGKWIIVEALIAIETGDLFLIDHPTFTDYLRDKIGIPEKTYRQWQRAHETAEAAKAWGAPLKNEWAARALRETAEAARKTVCLLAKSKAGDRDVTARDIRNAANALMEAMGNVAAGDDVAALPELAEQSHNEAGQRTSMAIDKRQGWSSATQWRMGMPLPMPGDFEPGKVYEFKWRVIDDATS